METCNLPVSEGGDREVGEGHFIRNCSDRSRGNGCKLKEGKFRLDTRKKFFAVGMVRYWNRLWMLQPWQCSERVGQGLNQPG